jgi:hypothetical protein
MTEYGRQEKMKDDDLELFIATPKHAATRLACSSSLILQLHD